MPKIFLRLMATLAMSLVLTVSSFLRASDAEEVYTFGVVPQFEARKLAEIWTPILEDVSARSGVTLKMVGSPKIPVFEQSFQAGEFDFAYMNPYHSLVAMDKQGYHPILRDGGRQLFGILVVRKDSEYKEVSDLEGQTIAYPAPNALGASLLMRAVLDREFGLKYTPDYVNTHSSSYLNVVLGEAAAAGGVMGTFNSLNAELRNELRILYETVRMAPHPITVHPRVPKDVSERVTQAFVDLAATEDGQAMLKRIPMKKLIQATKEDYEGLKALDLDAYFVQTDPTE